MVKKRIEQLHMIGRAKKTNNNYATDPRYFSERNRTNNKW